MEMLLTGDPLPAREALAAGLINRVVPADRLAAETRALAERIASSSPYVIAIGKEAFYRQADLSQSQAYDFAEETMSINAKAADAHEGIAAFLEKRAPDWGKSR
jgi:enoyl-CoA hydratase/carnithine racemase